MNMQTNISKAYSKAYVDNNLERYSKLQKITRIIYLMLGIICFMLLLTKGFASDITISMPSSVNIYNNEVRVPVFIYNPTNQIKLYEFTYHSSPIESTLSNNAIRVNPRTSAKIEIIIKPLINDLGSKYNSNLEIKIDNDLENRLIPLTIIQNRNITCNTDINYSIYDNNSTKYVKFIFKNFSNNKEEIQLISLTNVNNFKTNKFIILENSFKEFEYKINSIDKQIKLDYKCNTLVKNLIINSTIQDLEKEISSSNSFAMISIGKINFKNFFSSNLFSMLLIIVLLLLVISFTSRYIQYINRPKIRLDRL
ncbi:MAG: hypothetical protein V1824_04645 [archaeon]